MGKVYAPPAFIKQPDLFTAHSDIKAYFAAEAAYVKEVSEFAKKNGKGKLAGELIQFPVADNYAQYIVYSTTPVVLLHLPIGDGYQYQHVNRLTATDIKEKVHQQVVLQSSRRGSVMNRPVAVGKSDTTSKVFYFSTVADGEEAIALLETVIPVSVHAGDYFIDAPEEMVNGDLNPEVTTLRNFVAVTNPLKHVIATYLKSGHATYAGAMLNALKAAETSLEILDKIIAEYPEPTHHHSREGCVR